MRIIRFTIKQTGQDIGSVPIREQAVAAAKARAQRTGIYAADGWMKCPRKSSTDSLPQTSRRWRTECG